MVPSPQSASAALNFRLSVLCFSSPSGSLLQPCYQWDNVSDLLWQKEILYSVIREESNFSQHKLFVIFWLDREQECKSRTTWHETDTEAFGTSIKGRNAKMFSVICHQTHFKNIQLKKSFNIFHWRPSEVKIMLFLWALLSARFMLGSSAFSEFKELDILIPDAGIYSLVRVPFETRTSFQSVGYRLCAAVSHWFNVFVSWSSDVAYIFTIMQS